jgi:hypothetical protein
MPTVFRLFGFDFKFYSNDHNPIHIHAVKGGSFAKFTLFPVRLVESNGLKHSELKKLERIIEDNRETIAEHWNRHFNKNR